MSFYYTGGIMRLVAVAFTALALAACNVGEPRAGEAKSFFKRDRDKTWGIVFEGQPSRSDSPKQFFIVEASFAEEWKISIRAIDLISDRSEKIDTWKFKPSSHADCIEHFSEEYLITAGSRNDEGHHRVYRKGESHRWIRVLFSRDGRKLHSVGYSALGPDGNPVNYTSKATIAYDKWKSLLEDGDDCDHVSQSGEEEGSAAP